MKNEKTPVPGQGFVNRLSPKMIAFLYALIGAVWIITSDTIVHMIGRNPDIITQLQTYKGWFYVAMTALMLYFLIRLYGNRLMTAMATLRESEERNRLLVESITDYEIYMLDTDGRITAWNLGAQGSKGYRRDEVIGRLHSLFYRNEDIERGVPAQELRQAAERGKIEREGWRARRDGSLFLG